MEPIDVPLTFGGHPDQARPLEAVELFGIRVRGNTPTDVDNREPPTLEGETNADDK